MLITETLSDDTELNGPSLVTMLMKTKFLQFKDVLQYCIAVKNNKIKNVKAYIILGQIVNICQDMNVEIWWRIRSRFEGICHDQRCVQDKAEQDPTCQLLQ